MVERREVLTIDQAVGTILNRTDKRSTTKYIILDCEKSKFAIFESIGSDLRKYPRWVLVHRVQIILGQLLISDLFIFPFTSRLGVPKSYLHAYIYILGSRFPDRRTDHDSRYRITPHYLS